MNPRTAMLPVRPLARGFTLVEALVVLAIMAVLLTIVVPSFSSVFLSNKLSSYANAWAASAQLARSEAVKRNAAVTLCRWNSSATTTTTCATSGTWQQGWIVRAADGTVIATHEGASPDYHFTSSAYSIDFQPTGVGATTTTLTLCRASPSAGNQERQITLSTTGRTTVSTTKTGICA